MGDQTSSCEERELREGKEFRWLQAIVPFGLRQCPGCQPALYQKPPIDWYLS